MIEVGESYFYIRENGKIERGDVRAYKVNGDKVLIHMRDKHGLFEWIDSNDVYQTLGAAMNAKANSKGKWRPW